jgi:hypothetical protein
VLAQIRKRFADTIGDYPRYEQTQDVETYIRAARAVPNPAAASLAGVAELARRAFFHVIGRDANARS